MRGEAGEISVPPPPPRIKPHRLPLVWREEMEVVPSPLHLLACVALSWVALWSPGRFRGSAQQGVPCRTHPLALGAEPEGSA